jgi:hypothetical protein
MLFETGALLISLVENNTVAPAWSRSERSEMLNVNDGQFQETFRR